jgi:hypothetical protein
VEGEIFKNRMAISKEKAWQFLGVLSTVRSVTNEVHEISITCISIFHEIKLETSVQVHVRESSGLCFIMKVFNRELFEKFILLPFSIN